MKKASSHQIAKKYFEGIFIFQVVFVLVLVPLLYTVVVLRSNGNKPGTSTYKNVQVKEREIDNSSVAKFKFVATGDNNENHQAADSFFPVI